MTIKSRTSVKIQRISALLLALSLLLGACQYLPNPGGTETSAAPETDPTATAPVANADAVPGPTATQTAVPQFPQLDKLQIHFWHPWTGALSHEIDLLVDQFNQTNPWGIHVIVRKTGSSMALTSYIDNITSADELPQVAAAPSEQLVAWLERDQLVVPLDDWIDDAEIGLSEQQRAEFGLVFWLQDQSQERQVGISAQRSAQVMFYNQTWAQELGFDAAPQTAEEFRTQVCTAARANLADSITDNDGTGGWIVDTDGLTIYSWLKVFETGSVLQGDPPTFVFDQPQVEQAFTFLRGMLDEGCAWIARNPNPQEYFAGRQALIYTANLLDLPLQASIQAKSGSQDVWTILPFPGNPRPTLVVSGQSYGILRSTTDQELASWLFVRWMSSAEVQARILTAGGGLPVSISAAELADGAMRQNPQWAQTVSWIPFAQPAPQAAGWRVARFILGDAANHAMQSYVPAGQIPEILAELDATIAEALAQKK